jgi:ABC-type bacteriocin/lantibiotic exporter with double-glycine peptidase domain
MGEKFGITWFLPVMGRFKFLFSEVFAASFFLQSFGLVTPLFSQVIIDKEKGKILERGTHEELMEIQEGIYRGLYRVQNNERPRMKGTEADG